MKNKISFSKSQKGLSAIETLFVIMIATLVIIGALSMGYKMFGNQQNAQEQSDIATLMVNTRSLKGASGYGTSSFNLIPQLVATNGIPETMTYTAGIIYNSWGGPVSVISAGGQSFMITSSLISKAGCIAVSTRLAKSSAFTTRINAGTPIVGEVTSAAATTECVGATNTIEWTVSS